MKIAVLGAGKMGISFSKSFLKYELIRPEHLSSLPGNLPARQFSPVFSRALLSLLLKKSRTWRLIL